MKTRLQRIFTKSCLMAGAGIVVASSCCRAEEDELRDIHAPLEKHLGVWEWTFVVIGGLLLLAGAVWLLRKIFSTKEPAPAPLSPREEVRVRLAEVLKRLGEERDEVFCGVLSDAVRTFVEREYGVPACEQTTEELLEEIARQPAVAGEPLKALGEFLQQCDLAKFARQRLGEEERRRLHGQAVKFIDAVCGPVAAGAAAGESEKTVPIFPVA